MLNPDFPIISGSYQMTSEWYVNLPGEFNRRLEDNALVIWCRGFTIWIVVWHNDQNESTKDRLSWLKSDMPQDAFDIEQDTDGKVLRLAYRLVEDSNDDRVPAFYCFAVGESGHTQVSIYFDDVSDVDLARQIWRSLDERIAP